MANDQHTERDEQENETRTVDIPRARVSIPLIMLIGVIVSVIVNVWAASQFFSAFRTDIRELQRDVSEVKKSVSAHNEDSKQIHALQAATMAKIVTDVAVLQFQVSDHHPNTRNNEQPR